jgi:hypothetical protein
MPLKNSQARLLLTAVVLGLALGSQAQHQSGVKVQNLPNFDLRKFHFGFLLSYNNSDFFVKLDERSPFRDSLMVLNHIRQPGFNLGIVSSLNLDDYWSLRFIPSLSFQDRFLDYQFLESDGSISVYRKQVESTYLEFPVLMKFRSQRINNFAVYALGGGKFGIDMASKDDVNPDIDDEVVVKLRRYDYGVEVGAGADMFLPYFKFGVELKFAMGIPNLLIDDGTRFSRPIESLRTKVWVLTFTFEG